MAMTSGAPMRRYSTEPLVGRVGLEPTTGGL